MTEQSTHTIASVKQSMQRHIYDLTSSLAIARAATEGLLPEAYSDQEEVVNLMIRQAHVFSDKLVGELANMGDLEKLEASRAQEAAASDGAVNDTPSTAVNVDEACEVIRKQSLLVHEARSVLKLMADADEEQSVHLENAAIIISGTLEEVVNSLDKVLFELGKSAQKEVQS